MGSMKQGGTLMVTLTKMIAADLVLDTIPSQTTLQNRAFASAIDEMK